MLKALWFLAKTSLLIAAVIWCLQHPGVINITWHGYLIETSVSFVTAILLLFLGIYTIIYRIFRGFVSVPSSLRRYHALKSREQGYHDVTSGLVAVAAGDGRSAEKYARRAQSRVPDTPLTKLLTAQSSLLNGDALQARRIFVDLLDDNNAAFFGIRGLLQETLKSGDVKGALEHIRKAAHLQPKRGWVTRTLFDLETRNQEWKQAEAALKKAKKYNVFSDETALHHKQAILLARADDAFNNNEPVQAHRLARRAFNLNPAFTPAATRLVKFYEHVGKNKSAIRIVQKAWTANPHPDLAVTWMQHKPVSKKTSTSPYEQGKDIWLWAQRLYSIHPEHRASLQLMGKAAIEAKHWREARDFLIRAADYKNLAALERIETNNDTRAREWLEKAATAQPDPKWVCTDCGHTTMTWDALCTHCGIFNTAEWMIPEGDIKRTMPTYTLTPPVNDLTTLPTALEV